MISALRVCPKCGTEIPVDAPEGGCPGCLLESGVSLLDRRFQDYEICCREDGVTLDELGRGAMGITYLAKNLTLGSLVALKVITARYSEDPESRERFPSRGARGRTTAAF